MTRRQLSWQANAEKPIGQSAYRRLSPCHKNNRNRRQLKDEINRKKINENVFIDVICCDGEKIARPDQFGSQPNSILAIALPPAEAELRQSELFEPFANHYNCKQLQWQ